MLDNLRIGNIVGLFNEGSWVLKVIEPLDFSIIGMNPDLYKPIFLSDEWHRKFGVSKNGFGSYEYHLPKNNNFNLIVIFNNEYVFIRQMSGDKISYDDDMISIWNRDLVKRDMYVHEWQNIYKTLTGVDINFNIEGYEDY